MSSSEPPGLFDACTPREDVLDGTLQEDQFAASLATVAHSPDDAAPVYRDVTQFFDMTYPTAGLQTLLSNLAGRFLQAVVRTVVATLAVFCVSILASAVGRHTISLPRITWPRIRLLLKIYSGTSSMERAKLVARIWMQSMMACRSTPRSLWVGTWMRATPEVIEQIRTPQTRERCGAKLPINSTGPMVTSI